MTKHSTPLPSSKGQSTLSVSLSKRKAPQASPARSSNGKTATVKLAPGKGATTSRVKVKKPGSKVTRHNSPASVISLPAGEPSKSKFGQKAAPASGKPSTSEAAKSPSGGLATGGKNLLSSDLTQIKKSSGSKRKSSTAAHVEDKSSQSKLKGAADFVSSGGTNGPKEKGVKGAVKGDLKKVTGHAARGAVQGARKGGIVGAKAGAISGAISGLAKTKTARLTIIVGVIGAFMPLAIVATMFTSMLLIFDKEQDSQSNDVNKTTMAVSLDGYSADAVSALQDATESTDVPFHVPLASIHVQGIGDTMQVDPDAFDADTYDYDEPVGPHGIIPSKAAQMFPTHNWSLMDLNDPIKSSQLYAEWLSLLANKFQVPTPLDMSTGTASSDVRMNTAIGHPLYGISANASDAKDAQTVRDHWTALLTLMPVDDAENKAASIYSTAMQWQLGFSASCLAGNQSTGVTGDWTSPLPGSPAPSSGQDFGPRSIGQGWHDGLDMTGPSGALDPILAAASGTVITAGNEQVDLYGNNLVEIEHVGGVTTLYGHMSEMNVSVGDQVTAGQVIGTEGTEGFSTGNHLHFGVNLHGEWVDPVVFFATRGYDVLSATPGTYRVIAANINKDRSTESTRADVATVLAEKPDFIAYNEVHNRSDKLLAPAGYALHRKPGARTGWSPVAWRTDRWSPVNQGTVKISDRVKRLPGQVGLRYANWVTLRNAQGQSVSVVSSHIAPNNSDTAHLLEPSLRVLANLTSKLRATGPVIVAGDFNMGYGTRYNSKILGAAGLKSTFDIFGESFKTHKGGGTVDYVFLGPSENISAVKQYSRRLNSDHFAVVADVRLVGESPPAPAPGSGFEGNQVRIVQANIPMRKTNAEFADAMEKVHASGPDFVSLNEMMGRRKAQFTPAGYDTWRAPQGNEHRQALGNVVGWRTDRWTKVASGRITMMKGGPISHDNRYAGWVTVKSTGTLGNVSFVSVHHMVNPNHNGPNKPLRKRLYREGMVKVQELVRHLEASGPVFLAGDFNHRASETDPWGPKAMLGAIGYQASFTEANQILKTHRGGGTVDYIFAPRGKATLVRQWTKRIPSDHLMLGADYTISDEAVQTDRTLPTEWTGTNEDGASVTLDKTQLGFAADIARVGQELGVSDDGIVVAFMTVFVETKFKNYASTVYPETRGKEYPQGSIGSDHDSVGLFQQRPVSGWGQPLQIIESVGYQAKAFFGGPSGPNNGSPRGLLDISGWETLQKGDAAQTVQGSAHPDRYAKWEAPAYELLGLVKGAMFNSDNGPCAGNPDSAAHYGDVPDGGYNLGPVKPHTEFLANTLGHMFGVTTIGGYRPSATDMGGHPAGLAIDLMVPMTAEGKAQGQAIADYAKANAGRFKIDYIIWYQEIWSVGRDGEGWRGMSDRGSDTANHFDHVHITLKP